MRTLYRSGRIHVPDRCDATAMLVDGDTIVWVGTQSGADAGSADTVVELDGALVTPAFVDGHVHLTETGLQLSGADLTGARSVREILDRVAVLARAGGPVLGHGWDEASLLEGRAPTRQELDRAAPGVAVYLSRVDVHSAVVSSVLAQATGLAGRDGWSDSGRLERDAHHAAVSATRAAITPQRRRELQRNALRAAAAEGIGAVHEMSAPHLAPPEDLRELAALTADQGVALPRVFAYRGVLAGDPAHARRLLEEAQVPLAGLGGDLCVDGSVGSRTAALRDDYTDAPGVRGHLYLSAEQVRDHVLACTGAGVQAAFHAIGDLAVDTVLDGFRQAADRLGDGPVRAGRHRVEHLELVDAAGVALAARLGLTAGVQPAFDAAWGGAEGMYAARLGAGRAAGMNPFGPLAAAGVPLLLGSDSPVTRYAPWEAVRACVLHHAPGHRISTAAAFAAHTRTGWQAVGLAGCGVLRPGAEATFAIWNAGELVVQGNDGPVPGRGSGAHPGAGALPDLSAGRPTPVCQATVVAGRMVYNRDVPDATQGDTPTTAARRTRPARQPS